MRIGRTTLERIFKDLVGSGELSRKQIACRLGISETSAGLGVTALSGLGLVSISKNALGIGRGEYVSVSRELTCLVIDLCNSGTLFALSEPSARVCEPKAIGHLPQRDSLANLAFTAKEIKKHLTRCACTPLLTAVALPGDLDDHEARLAILSEAGIKADIVVSCAAAATEYCTHLSCGVDDFAYMSIGRSIWGCSSLNPGKTLKWGELKVADGSEITLEEAWRWEPDEEILLGMLVRAVKAVEIISEPQTIYLSSTGIPAKIKAGMELSLPRLKDISAQFPVLGGMMLMCADRIFERRISGMLGRDVISAPASCSRQK